MANFGFAACEVGGPEMGRGGGGVGGNIGSQTIGKHGKKGMRKTGS
jgi:hypothetical protein